MMKKQYMAPEMDVLVLEQSDIITTSGGNAESGTPGTGGGGNGGIFDGDWE